MGIQAALVLTAPDLNRRPLLLRRLWLLVAAAASRWASRCWCGPPNRGSGSMAAEAARRSRTRSPARSKRDEGEAPLLPFDTGSLHRVRSWRVLGTRGRRLRRTTGCHIAPASVKAAATSSLFLSMLSASDCAGTSTAGLASLSSGRSGPAGPTRGAPFASLRQRQCLSSHRSRARRPRRRRYAPSGMRWAGVALPFVAVTAMRSATTTCQCSRRGSRRRVLHWRHARRWSTPGPQLPCCLRGYSRLGVTRDIQAQTSAV
jgi:hypothetical protein